ncbi:MAG: 50S ribosomal protein L24 [Acidimicrobiaceae bacterium]|nr:50S ribosomal protein L24 [Acidimicrobiaceae bacterium]
MAKSSKGSRPPRRSMKIVKGDKVVVLSGKDAGVEGTVERVIPAAGKVIVEGVNVAMRHQAPTRNVQQGGIIQKTMPIDASNVALLSPTDGKPTRAGYRFTPEGTKVRICRRTGADL